MKKNDQDRFADNHAVTLWDGAVARLGDFWTNGPLVLVFLRHYG